MRPVIPDPYQRSQLNVHEIVRHLIDVLDSVVCGHESVLALFFEVDGDLVAKAVT